MDLVILCKSEAKASSSCYYLVEVTYWYQDHLARELLNQVDQRPMRTTLRREMKHETTLLEEKPITLL